MPGYLRPEPETVLDAGYFDPVNKLRVSEAQALIDTDFEYGMQISKWENLELINNRPFTYSSSSTVAGVSLIQIATATPANPTKTVTVTTTNPHGLTVGTEIVVQDTFLNLANGSFIIETVLTPNTFTYSAKAPNYNAGFVNIFDVNRTAIYFGTLYSNARIGGPANIEALGRFITVTTTVPHGLALGNEVAVTGITTSPVSLTAPNGSFFVISVINETTFRYYANVAVTGTPSTGNIYVRPQGSFLHRPFDGGIIFSANASSNNQQAIRQTRRYFRYQSGKGVQISSGTVMKPNLSIEALQYNSTTELVTVQTKEQHNIQPGTTLKIFGANEAGYNGTFSVVTVTGYNTFTYAPSLPKPTEAKASGFYYAVVDNWYGCANRLGMFDSQNGMFFEYDGQTLYAVKRSSTYQISGRVTVTRGSNVVSQTNVAFPTSFTNQLEPGDFVVIRGQSYRIESITSDTSMKISPSYRGGSDVIPTAQFVQIAKTIDTKIPQSEWNLDTMDGNGPSGFTLDLTKMQMFYIDYSWYGAGFVRWGLRGIDGTVYYVHKLINNNTNSEAYMRSGNLPGRYESNTFGKVTSITQSISDSANTINVKNTEGFAPKGTLLLRSGTNYEYVNYAAKTSTSFTGVVREKNGATIEVSITQGSNKGTVAEIAGIQIGQRVLHPSFPDNTYVSEINGNEITFNTAALQTNPNNVIFAAMTNAVAKTFTLSESQPVVSVEQAFPTYSASMSHWGTSVIMDGKFDDDKSLLFTFGQTNYINIPPSATVSQTVTGVSGSRVLVIPSPTTTYKVGMVVSDNTAGFQNGATILTIQQNEPVGSTTVVLSLSLTQNVTAQSITFNGGNNRALFSVRVAPSVDNGISANFGQRELINRMQLTLRTLGVTTKTADANMLVTAILNGVPSGSTAYQNAVRNSTVLYNSSLAQFADYQGSQNTIVVTGGEVTGGFYVQGTDSIALDTVRDLGNSILGGGGISTSTGVYPDGPDVLTIVVTNLSATPIDVLGRIGWSEAQA
jgi:hypothetical protein